MTISRAALGGAALLVLGAALGNILSGLALWISVVVAVLIGIGYAFERVRRALRTRKDERHVVGLERLYPDYLAARGDLFAAIAVAQGGVTLIGISMRTFLENDDFVRALRKFLRLRETRLDAFFLEPGSDAAHDRAREEHDDERNFDSEIETQIRRLLLLAKHCGCAAEQVRIYTYASYPHWRIQLIDDRVMYVGGYPEAAGHVANPRGSASCVMRLRTTAAEGSLFATFHGIVARCRTSATHYGAT